MEYLTLQDIPHRHYHPQNTRSMASPADHHRAVAEKSGALPTLAASSLLRNSPPIQPNEQRTQQASLPSFSQLLQTAGVPEPSPPSTPSRRNASMESSPIGGGTKPRFEEPVWGEMKRRRLDHYPDPMPPRPSDATDYSGYDTRRPSAIDPALMSGYNSPRSSLSSATPSLASSHHRPSLPYPPPPSAMTHVRHQSSPVPQGHAAFSQPPHGHPHAHHHPSASYPPPAVQHHAHYEPRAYYHEHHAAVQVHPYERPHDTYSGRPAYHPGPLPTYAPDPYHQQYNFQFQHAMAGNESSFNRKRRGNLPKEATGILKSWFQSHRDSPYPTEDEKVQLCNQTGLTLNQVSNWFINARRRAPQKEARETGVTDEL